MLTRISEWSFPRLSLSSSFLSTLWFISTTFYHLGFAWIKGRYVKRCTSAPPPPPFFPLFQKRITRRTTRRDRNEKRGITGVRAEWRQWWLPRRKRGIHFFSMFGLHWLEKTGIDLLSSALVHSIGGFLFFLHSFRGNESNKNHHRIEKRQHKGHRTYLYFTPCTPFFYVLHAGIYASASTQHDSVGRSPSFVLALVSFRFHPYLHLRPVVFLDIPRFVHNFSFFLLYFSFFHVELYEKRGKQSGAESGTNALENSSLKCHFCRSTLFFFLVDLGMHTIIMPMLGIYAFTLSKKMVTPIPPWFCFLIVHTHTLFSSGIGPIGDRCLAGKEYARKDKGKVEREKKEGMTNCPFVVPYPFVLFISSWYFVLVFFFFIF